MSWNNVTTNTSLVVKETEVTFAGTTVTTEGFQIEAGNDFTVYANIAETPVTLTGATALNILVSLDGITYVPIKSNLIADISGAPKAAIYDTAVEGIGVWYKIQLVSASSETDTIKLGYATKNAN